MQYTITLPPRMKWWVERTGVISTLLFTYPQVCEYGSFHFCAMRLAIRLSVASTSTPKIHPLRQRREWSIESRLNNH